MKAFVCLATMLIAMKYNLLIRFGRAFGRGMVFGHVSTLRPLNYSVTFSDSFHHQYFIFFFFFLLISACVFPRMPSNAIRMTIAEQTSYRTGRPRAMNAVPQ